ncbi:MAG: hypothetical protein ACOYM2_11085 [Rectinemataceae bacterium]
MTDLTEFQSDIKHILEQERGKAQSVVNGAMGETNQPLFSTLCSELSGSYVTPISPIGLRKTEPVERGSAHG